MAALEEVGQMGDSVRVTVFIKQGEGEGQHRICAVAHVPLQEFGKMLRRIIGNRIQRCDGK